MKKLTPSSKRIFAFSLLLTTLLFSSQLTAQVALQWAKTYNGPANSHDHLVAMVTDKEGNLYVTGTSNGTLPNITDYATIKYNAAGEQQWVARFDGATTGQDVATAMAIDRWGNIYVTGWTGNAGGNSDYATVKYNNNGVQQWIATYNGPTNGWDNATAIAVDSSGNVYVTGYSVGDVYPDYATVKYNGDGVQLWAQRYDGAAHTIDMAMYLALDPVTRDVYVTGYTTGNGTGQDYTTVKYTTGGVQQWVQTYNGSFNRKDEPRGIAIDNNGHVYVTGVSDGEGTVLDYATIQYSAAGVQQWVQRYNGPSNSYDEPAAIAVDREGMVYVTGLTDNGSQSADIATVKYNSAGQPLWVQLYGSAAYSAEVPHAMALDSAGNIYIAGYIATPAVMNDFLTLKYNGQGVLQWAEQHDFFGNLDNATAIAVDALGDVYAGGSARLYTLPAMANDDYGVVKYLQPQPLRVTAGPDTTVYYGYGSTCVTLKAVAEGGLPPYRYEWIPPMQGTPFSANTTVCPLATTRYSVKVTDAINNVATAQVVVNVVDVRCGTKGKNVMICHKGQVLCVAAEAVKAHLEHGDVVGPCATGLRREGIVTDVELPLAYKLSVYPNPLQGQATIEYDLPMDAQVSIVVYDLVGREVGTVVHEKSRVGTHTLLFDATRLSPGIYQCRMMAGEQVVKVIKMQVR